MQTGKQEIWWDSGEWKVERGQRAVLPGRDAIYRVYALMKRVKRPWDTISYYSRVGTRYIAFFTLQPHLISKADKIQSGKIFLCTWPYSNEGPIRVKKGPLYSQIRVYH